MRYFFILSIGITLLLNSSIPTRLRILSAALSPSLIVQAAETDAEADSEYVSATLYGGVYSQIIQRVAEAKQAKEKWRQVIQQDSNNAEAHLQLATALYELDRYQDAEASYRKVIRLVPNYEEAYFGLTKALARQDRDEEVLSVARQAVKVAPDSGEAWLELGFDLSSYGENDTQVFAEIEAAYRKSIELSPDNTEAYLLLNNLLRHQNRHKAREALVRSLIERQPGNFRAIHALAVIQSRNGNEANKEAVYRDAITRNPDNPEAYVVFADWLYKQSVERGTEAYREAIRRFPQNKLAYEQLSKNLSQVGEHAAVVEIQAEASAAGVRSHLLLEQTGQALIALNELEKAEEAFKSAIALMSQQKKPELEYIQREAWLYIQLGLLYQTIALDEEAITAYQKALKLAYAEEAVIELGRLLLQKEQYVKAERLYQDLGKYLSDQESRVRDWQVALRALGQDVKAVSIQQDLQAGRLNPFEATHREIIRISPETALYYEILGFHLLRENRPQEAEFFLKEAVRLGKDSFTLRTNMGRALFAQSKLAEANEWYSKALLLAPEDTDYNFEELGELYQNIGELYQQQQMFGTALEFYYKAFDVDSSNRSLKDRIAEVRERLSECRAVLTENVP